MSKSTEQRLSEMRAMRAMLIPNKFIDNHREREKNLANIRRFRESISPVCKVTNKEREKNLSYISYISNKVRKR